MPLKEVKSELKITIWLFLQISCTCCHKEAEEDRIANLINYKDQGLQNTAQSFTLNNSPFAWLEIKNVNKNETAIKTKQKSYDFEFYFL
jgi:hypothetical protein